MLGSFNAPSLTSLARAQFSALGARDIEPMSCAPKLAFVFVPVVLTPDACCWVLVEGALDVAVFQRFCSWPSGQGVDWYTVPSLASLHL